MPTHFRHPSLDEHAPDIRQVYMHYTNIHSPVQTSVRRTRIISADIHQMGSGESRFTVLLIVGGKVTKTDSVVCWLFACLGLTSTETALVRSVTVLGRDKDCSSSVLLYVHRDRMEGRGAQDGHLDFHTAPAAVVLLNVLGCRLTY